MQENNWMAALGGSANASGGGGVQKYGSRETTASKSRADFDSRLYSSRDGKTLYGLMG